MEVSLTEKDDDSLFRRSSRKRRKINYKSEKQLRVIVKKENETDGKPKKRGRPRKKPSPQEDSEIKPVTKCFGTTTAKKHCKKYGLDEVDVMIEEYIKLGDEDGMKRIISSLQCALQRTPKKSVTVNGCMNTSPEVMKEAPTPVKQKINKTVEVPRTTPENPQPQNMNPVNLQPASSIPANLQTKSISVHGNSVIMQGVIDTGMAQTSCFLIPIDIGNIAQIPGGVQVIQSPSPQMISPNVGQSPVLIPINQQPPQNLPQQHQPQNLPQQQPASLPKQQQLPIFTQNQPPSSSAQQQQQPLKSLPQLQPQQQQPQLDSLNNPITTTSISTGLINGHGVTPTPNKQNAGVNPNLAVSAKDKTTSVINVNQASRSAPLVVEKVPATSQAAVSLPDKPHPQQTNKTTMSAPSSVVADPIDAVVESLQSTESLSEIIDQLSHDDMVSIINILTNSNTLQPTTSTVTTTAATSDTMSTDFAKLASDVDKLSKLEPDQLSSGVVNQLVAELTKLLTSTSTTSTQADGGQDKLLTKLLDTAIQEEDEDFQHVQIVQQHEQVNNTSGLKCYMCGLVCVDEKAFITHMRFHLFNYRYSCYECGFGTSSMNELLLHKAEEHEGDLTKISPELLKQLPKSERATIPDLEETLIQCPECKDNIALNSLSAHMNQKHKPLHKASPGRKPKCTICTALVENKLELAAHVKHHGKEENSFACYFCTQTYSSISSLQLHTTNYHASLAAKRHYKCTQCAREFSGSYHLIRHVKTVHEQRRDYQCSKCDKSFVELHCLRRHIRNIHNLIRDHTCPVCNRGFTYRQDMFRHIMSVHQKIRDIKCPLCGEKFYHRYFIGHAYRQHDLKVKYRDGICYIYDDAGNVIHKIT